MNDRPLELAEIQGNVLGGFNTDVQEHIVLAVEGDQFARAASWLALIADQVTVVSEVRAQRAAMKAAADRPSPWLFVAIGHRLLKAVAPDVLIRDEAFNGGMLKRAPSILGDRTDPTTWVAGNDEKPVDVFMIVAANDEAAVATRSEQIVAAAAGSGLRLTWRETTRRLDDHEHFGFRDGISQPLVIGDDLGGERGAGQFVFGYPQIQGGAPYVPAVDDRQVTDNGSLLVWRRLRQDVGAFRQFCHDTAAVLAAQWPGLTASHLAALIVGRWPSGTPLEHGVITDPKTSPRENDFKLSDDEEGKVCPLGAHIRKVNPRLGPRDVVEIPRMLRRGIPFGRPYDDAPTEGDRGLAFLAFQTSIRNQFEFITQHWMNDATKPARADDLLVGRGSRERSMSIWGPTGPIKAVAPIEPWITPTGGAYLFVPSRTGLRKLAEPSPPPGLWMAKQIFFNATGRLKELF